MRVYSVRLIKKSWAHMRTISARCIVVISLTLALAACTIPPPAAGKALPPGYLYKGKFLDIRSPNEKGWYLVSASHAGMQFTHRGEKKGETFAAQVFTFPLPEMQNGKEFVDFLVRGFETDADSKHINIINSNFQVSNARKYRCVNVSTVVRDKRAVTSSTQHENLLLQSISLYCRHPVQRLAGFAIVYSHRGKSLYPGLRKQAQAFIAGVQVPGH